MSAAQLAARGRPDVIRRAASIGPLYVFCGVVCLALIVVAVVGPWIAPHDPTRTDVIEVFAGSSPTHLLGTDDTGRDILSRLIVGTRVSLAGPALVVLLSTVLGVAVAVTAAWLGGWVDAALSRVVDILFAFPGLILAVVAVALFGTGFVSPVVALSIAYVPVVARVLRSAAIKERNLPYIAALRVQGASGWSICFKHLVPNLMPLVVAQAAVSFGYAMLDLAAISYLGLGIQPPSPDWGVMVAEGQPSIINGYPQQSLYAGLLVVVAVVAFNLVGERVAQRFETAGAR
ncbi:ABC transporter permease [Aeromicrobium endophyticum]|uniref:ABC transporter permease n=1 Tax=Aeromicrobium endophyticum TaxID=2292704 RepID=A0A371PCG5_9ACTN|nr:ABC transporter permease [Aeromicrobium endophyticum]REK73607.1 ABC transporter permease [Aeromicrobium endophyticum]